jgi:hypothetical protein
MMTNPAPQRTPRGNLRRLNADKLRLVAAQSEWKAREVLMTGKEGFDKKSAVPQPLPRSRASSDLPDGQRSRIPVQPLAKNKSLLFFRNMWFLPAHPTP